MFKHIEIDNFKSFVNFSIDLTPTTFVIGNNGAGKSSLLEAIELLTSSVSQEFSTYLSIHGWTVANIKSKLMNSNRLNFSSVIVLEDETGKTEYKWVMTLGIYSGKNEISLLSEKVTLSDGTNLLKYSKREGYQYVSSKPDHSMVSSALAGMNVYSSVMKNLSLERLDSRLVALISFLKASESFEMLNPEQMRLSSRGEKHTIGINGRNLPAYIKNMSPRQKDNYLSKVQKLLGKNIIGVDTQTQGKPGWTQIKTMEHYSDKDINVTSKEISDGTLRLLAFLAISEMQSPECTYLLDEIENGINANYAESLIHIFKDMYVEKRHQIVATTHSTVLLDYVDPNSVVYMFRDENGAARAVRPFDIEELKKQLAYMYPGEIVLNTDPEELTGRKGNE